MIAVTMCHSYHDSGDELRVVLEPILSSVLVAKDTQDLMQTAVGLNFGLALAATNKLDVQEQLHQSRLSQHTTMISTTSPRLSKHLMSRIEEVHAFKYY